MAALFDVDVGGSGGDGDNVVVAISAQEKGTRLFFKAYQEHTCVGNSTWDPGSEAISL